MSRTTRAWSRSDPSRHPSVAGTAALVLALASAWLVVYSIGVLGAIWRMREPQAPTPVLDVGAQRADLVLAATQLVLGLVALTGVGYVRRKPLRDALPPRRGTAMAAAISFCAAVAASSACALALDRLGVARFDLSTPAVVASPTMAVVSALSAGLREEPLLAALPVLLLVGRLPIGWIMVLAGAMRGVLYLYFGFGGFVWAFLWGAAAVWVYHEYRRLWVLVVVHGLVMNVQALDRVLGFDSAATLLQWANILILFGAFTLWLVPRALGSVLPIESKRDPDQPRDASIRAMDAPPELPLVPPSAGSAAPRDGRT